LHFTDGKYCAATLEEVEIIEKTNKNRDCRLGTQRSQDALSEISTLRKDDECQDNSRDIAQDCNIKRKGGSTRMRGFQCEN
jgi:hypothetical protein